MDPDPDLDVLVRLSRNLTDALGATGEHQLVWATPCTDWDLSALIDHVTGGNWFTAGVLDGNKAEKALAAAMARFLGGSTTLNDAISSVNDQLNAFQRCGVLQASFHHVAGDLTGRQILRVRLHDLIVHTWDIEQTLEPPASLPAELARWGLAELADPESLTAKHFSLASVPRAEDFQDTAAAYLRAFDRDL